MISPHHDPWTRLALETRERRRVDARDHRNELQVQLKRLVQAGKCPDEAIGWVRKSNDRRHSQIDLAKSNTAGLKKHSALPLKQLAWLEDGALLSFIVTVRADEVVKYSVGPVGTIRATGAQWYARFDLDEAEAGTDPCAHALLHCHVGADAQGAMAVRVPLPWLAPAQALDWLIAVADATPPGITWDPFQEAVARVR